MKSLPILPGESLPIVDKEGSIHVKYSLSYVVDAKLPEYQKMMIEYSKSKDPFIPKAKTLIQKQSKGKRWKKGEKEMEIAKKAYELWIEKTANDPSSANKEMDMYIDFFVEKMEILNKEELIKNNPSLKGRLLEFPKDYKDIRLSQTLSQTDKEWLWVQISQNLSKLTRMDDELLKK